VATRCWPECLTDYGGAACAPQAMLSDDGIPGMCEADVHGALTALILRETARATPFVADLVDIDRAGNTAVFWHCGLAGLDVADPLVERRAIDHPNRGVPILHEFPLRPGRITIARLSQAGDRNALVIGSGELLSRPRPFSGTSGVVRFEASVDELVARVMGAGLEHHHGIVHGDHRATLRALAEHWDIPVIELTP
jgi:L-fucose isomerase-like protein